MIWSVFPSFWIYGVFLELDWNAKQQTLSNYPPPHFLAMCIVHKQTVSYLIRQMMISSRWWSKLMQQLKLEHLHLLVKESHSNTQSQSNCRLFVVVVETEQVLAEATKTKVYAPHQTSQMQASNNRTLSDLKPLLCSTCKVMNPGDQNVCYLKQKECGFRQDILNGVLFGPRPGPSHLHSTEWAEQTAACVEISFATSPDSTASDHQTAAELCLFGCHGKPNCVCVCLGICSTAICRSVSVRQSELCLAMFVDHDRLLHVTCLA